MSNIPSLRLRSWLLPCLAGCVLSITACGSGGGSPTSGQGGSPAGGQGGSPTTGQGGSSTGGQAGSGTAGTSGGGAASGGTPGTGGVVSTGGAGGHAPGVPVSPYIVVDQFGYLPDGEKIAVIRDPQTGFDAAASFTPGIQLRAGERGHRRAGSTPRRRRSGTAARPTPPRATRPGGSTFTSVTTPGDYYVLDVDRGVRSYPFHDLGPRLSRRAQAGGPHALLSARRPEQGRRPRGRRLDRHAELRRRPAGSQCRLFSDKNNAATERDVWGGWYDAGDLNKYTSWTAGYVESLLRAYAENPTIWTDDYNIPESGNGVPDVLDEAKWGSTTSPACRAPTARC